MRLYKVFGVAFFILLLPVIAQAYIGPGLGVGALGAVLGFIFSIILALLGIFWYPIKIIYKKLRSKKTKKEDES